MNIRKIVTYNALRRQFTADESAFADVLFNATESERELLIGALQPEKPAGRKTTTTERKIEHCVACDYTKRALVHKDPNADGYHEFQSAKSEKKASKSSQSSSTKSPRSSGMAAQLKSRVNEQREAATTTKDEDYDPDAERCMFPRGDRQWCYLLSDHNVHHMKTHPEYHPFQPSTTAPPAPARSPANGAQGSTTQNSETQPEDVGTVAHGASGGRVQG